MRKDNYSIQAENEKMMQEHSSTATELLNKNKSKIEKNGFQNGFLFPEEKKSRRGVLLASDVVFYIYRTKTQFVCKIQEA